LFATAKPKIVVNGQRLAADRALGAPRRQLHNT
jgi:hypothetical protein